MSCSEDSWVPTDYLLTCLQEECAEVIQVISKIKRFGLDDCHPDTGVVNKDWLIAEMHDVSTLIHHCYSRVTGQFWKGDGGIKMIKIQEWYNKYKDKKRLLPDE